MHRIHLLLFALSLSGCASLELESPPDEPAPVPAVPDQSLPAAGGGDLCGQGEQRPALFMEWAELPDDGSARSGARLWLVLTSEVEGEVDADLGMRVYADDQVHTKGLGRHRLAQGVPQRIPVDVAVAGLDPRALAFSAQLIVDATLSAGGRQIWKAGTDPIYFHADARSGDLLAYGDRAYRERFAAGDLRARLARRRPDDQPLSGAGIARRATAADLYGDPMDGR